MIGGDEPVSVVVVAGPTASGKSEMATRIAEAFGGTVVNADSMQVYRDLRILTARPEPADEARVPHRLYGVLQAAEPCSAGRWRGLALRAVEAAHAEGSLPVVVGGTGLYIRALLEGLSPVPDIPAEVRSAVRERLSSTGPAALLEDLRAGDPVTAARLAPGDTQRLLRALEVLEATRRPLSEWQRLPPETPVLPLRPLCFALMPPREALYAACDQRFDRMLASGAVQEVEALARQDLSPHLPIMRAVGVRELLRHVRGELALDEAADQARRATRRYAKRQLTWFRHQLPGAEVRRAQFSERMAEEIFSVIRAFLLTT